MPPLRKLRRDQKLIVQLLFPMRLSLELGERLDADPTQETDPAWLEMKEFMDRELEPVLLHIMQKYRVTEAQAEVLALSLMEELLVEFPPDKLKSMILLKENPASGSSDEGDATT
jgi:hypothetical protein